MVYPIIYRLIGFQPSFRWFLDFATIHDQRSMDPNGPFVSICCWMKLSFELNHLPVFVVFFFVRKNMLVNTIAMTDGRQFPHWLSPLYHFRSFSQRDGLERIAQQVSPLWYMYGGFLKWGG